MPPPPNFMPPVMTGGPSAYAPSPMGSYPSMPGPASTEDGDPGVLKIKKSPGHASTKNGSKRGGATGASPTTGGGHGPSSHGTNVHGKAAYLHKSKPVMKYDPETVQTLDITRLCRHFLDGNCSRKLCRFHHVEAPEEVKEELKQRQDKQRAEDAAEDLLAEKGSSGNSLSSQEKSNSLSSQEKNGGGKESSGKNGSSGGDSSEETQPKSVSAANPTGEFPEQRHKNLNKYSSEEEEEDENHPNDKS